jgi:predicted DNA-binding transcriptional regulator YafY
VNSTEPRRPAAALPPVSLTPEEAAAVAVALAAQPEGPYAAAGRAALAKIVAALEPDPGRRNQLLAAVERVEASRPAGAQAHPAGRRRPAADAVRPPRLVVLPGGLS